MERTLKAMRLVVAPAVVAVAFLAACGGDDPGGAIGTPSERVGASATARLEAQANERSAHLRGQARTYGAPADRRDATVPNPIEAGNRAVGEWLERRARLEGHARTAAARSTRATTRRAPADETAGDEFVPGSGRMPMR